MNQFLNHTPSSISGHIVDIEQRRCRAGRIILAQGRILRIEPLDSLPADAPFLLPALTDAHIHIESSMMIPRNFARVAVTHGVANAVCDPHEIANVLGVEGIDFMIADGRKSRFNFRFGLPSCVPSSHLETSGAVIDAEQTRSLILRDDLGFLAEMMNYPGVVFNDREVHLKLRAARKAHKPIDGHAPGLTGEDLRRYAAAGISTDHECSTLEEARERIVCGMKVIVREGSAARNFEALCPIIGETPAMVMLCSDDKHPDDLIDGHIDTLVRRGLRRGIPIWDLLHAAAITPVEHYAIGSGLLREDDPATFIAVDNLSDFNIEATLIEGHVVYNREEGLLDRELTLDLDPVVHPNRFEAAPITEEELSVDIKGRSVKVMVAHDGELYTSCEEMSPEEITQGNVQKIMVLNRYGNGRPQVGFIRGFDLKSGAMGATIAHDSHNLIVTGASDSEIVALANALIRTRGGVGVWHRGKTEILPLPIAGLMSDLPAEEISRQYRHLGEVVRELGCGMKSPFITMAFMALPVITELKITDKGLVDVRAFDFTELVTR